MTSVPMIDLRAQFETIRDEIYTAVRRVFETQRFVLGPEVEGLELEVAALCGSRHAIGCASGSDAIMLAVAAVLDRAPGGGLRPGSGPEPWLGSDREVVTSPFTFFASAGSVVHAGVRPRFIDIEPETYGIDPSLVAAAISSRTVAVLPVHLFGQSCEMDPILEASGSVPVIEDAAQAIGARYGAKPRERACGAIGLAGCLSFFPTKNLGGAGDGGMILTDDGALAEKLLKIRVHGGRQMYHHESVGWNSRLDELQAAVLRVKLPRLEAWNRARAAHAARFDAMLAETGLVSRGLVLPPVRRPDRNHTYHQYVVRVPGQGDGRGRDALRAHLTSCGISSGIYYPVPLHLQECFRGLGHARGDFPVAERACEEVLALPVFAEMSPDQQAAVVRGIAGHFGLA
jgi:dTDP-4-amino-4,6-dideoxygalactose transaminase